MRILGKSPSNQPDIITNYHLVHVITNHNHVTPNRYSPKEIASLIERTAAAELLGN